METIRQAKDYYDAPSHYDTRRPALSKPRSSKGVGLLSSDDGHAFARGLGWMSIGLGAIELWKNRQLSRTLGTGGGGRLYQIYGLREIGTGIGLLTSKNPTPWVWARVAGDLLDMATLAPELRPGHSQRKAAAAATAFVAGAALADLACAVKEAQNSRREKQRLLPPNYHPGLGR